MDALTRSFQRMFQVPAVYWAIAMVVAALSSLVESILGAEWLATSLVANTPWAVLLVLTVLMVFLVVVFLVLVPFGAATTRTALAVFHGEPIRFGMILAGFRRYAPVLGVALLTALPIMVAVGVGLAIMFAGFFAAIYGAGPSMASLLGVVWGLVAMIVLFIPAVYLLLRWSFGLFLVFDEGLGPVAALGRSWRMTQDRVLALFVVALVTGLAGSVASVAPPLMVFATGWAPLALGELYMEARSGRPVPVRNWDRETWADRVVVRDDED